MAVARTNVDKLLWPDDGITKGQLLGYLEAVAEPLLSELRDRPLTLIRAPDGVGGDVFFQKQAPAYTPEWIDTISLPSPASKRKDVRYILCNSLDTLMWLGNQAAIELHPALSRIDRLDRPDALVLDLDPPEGGFMEAIAVARVLRGVLDDLDLRASLKTTGGKGLHLYIPVERRYGFDETERAATRIAERAMDVDGDSMTLAFRKADRGGRVLVDVARNSPGATMVSAFSPRARAGAPVSFPVTWDELDRLDPSRFTVTSAPRKLDDDGVSGWLDARASRQRLPRALIR